MNYAMSVRVGFLGKLSCCQEMLNRTRTHSILFLTLILLNASVAISDDTNPPPMNQRRTFIGLRPDPAAFYQPSGAAFVCFSETPTSKLVHSPVWDSRSELPVSLEHALRLVEKQKSFNELKSRGFELKSVQIRKPNQLFGQQNAPWFYEIVYGLKHNLPDGSPIAPSAQYIVLMDETVTEPVVLHESHLLEEMKHQCESHSGHWLEGWPIKFKPFNGEVSSS